MSNVFDKFGPISLTSREMRDNRAKTKVFILNAVIQVASWHAQCTNPTLVLRKVLHFSTLPQRGKTPVDWIARKVDAPAMRLTSVASVASVVLLTRERHELQKRSSESKYRTPRTWSASQ